MAAPGLLLLPISVALTVLILPAAYGQIITNPCTPTMIMSLSSCINFVTNSTANGTSPTPDCCNSLSSLAGNSTTCACLFITTGIPFNLPINRTLAISLPRACNMPSLPLQCKASGTSVAPTPAPGPMALGPTSSSAPGISPTAPPTAAGPAPVSQVEPPPESDTPPATNQPSPPTNSTTPGSRPVETPPTVSGAIDHIPSPTIILLTIFASVMMKSY